MHSNAAGSLGAQRQLQGGHEASAACTALGMHSTTLHSLSCAESSSQVRPNGLSMSNDGRSTAASSGASAGATDP